MTITMLAEACQDESARASPLHCLPTDLGRLPKGYPASVAPAKSNVNRGQVSGPETASEAKEGSKVMAKVAALSLSGSAAATPEEWFTENPKIKILSHGEQTGVNLPPDTISVEQWAETICDLKKVKDQGLSYAELLAFQPTYAKWLQDNAKRSSLVDSPAVQDFAKFLERSGLKLVTVKDKPGLNRRFKSTEDGV